MEEEAHGCRSFMGNSKNEKDWVCENSPCDTRNTATINVKKYLEKESIEELFCLVVNARMEERESMASLCLSAYRPNLVNWVREL